MTDRSSFLRPAVHATETPAAKQLSGALSLIIGVSAIAALALTPSNALAAPASAPSVAVDLSAIGLRTGTDERIAPGRAPVVLRYPGSAPTARILLTPPASIRQATIPTPPAPSVLEPLENTVATLPATRELVAPPNRGTPAPTPTPTPTPTPSIETAAFPGPERIAPAPLLPVTRAQQAPAATQRAPVARQPASAPTPSAAQQASLNTPGPQTPSLPAPAQAAHRLRFEAGETTILAETRVELELVAAALMRHSSRIEIQAYAGAANDLSSAARRLSLRRGLAVRKYLVDQGVLQSRIDVRALGGVRDNGPGERVDIVLSSR